MSRKFTDSVQGNFDLVCEILNDAPPEAKERAKRAAVKIEQTFETIRREAPRDPAVALGTAFAIYFIAKELLDSVEHGDNKTLIQLLN